MKSKHLLLTLLTLLTLISSVWAEIKIVGDTTVGPNKLVRLSLDGIKLSDKSKVGWKVRGITLGTDGKPLVADTYKPTQGDLYMTGPQGEYLVEVRVVDFKQEVFEELETTIKIGDPAPPVPPTPPTPPTPPVPPVPPPSPAPIALPGVSVLIVEETGQRDDLPRGQALIFSSVLVKDYLNKVCTQDPRVATWKAFRMWDKDINLAGEDKAWVEAMKRPRESLPWIVISNPKGQSYEGPLPQTVVETLALLKKYAEGSTSVRKGVEQ